MRKHILAILLLMGFGGLYTGFAQTSPMRKVYLGSNESFVGELVGVNPNISYTFRNDDGSIKVIQFEEVVKIEKITSAINESISELPASNASVHLEQDDKLKVIGSVDLYYQYNFNERPLPTSFTESHNAFTLGMANVILTKNFNKVGFNADIAVGPRAEVANGHAGTTLSAIKQLYIFYAPIEQLTFTVGNFSTFVGYELINPGENIHYSTSYLFSNGPFFHNGLKVDYAISESFSLMLGIFNDTDNKLEEVQGKHIGTQIAFTKNSFSVFINYLTGVDVDLPGTTVRGHQIDLTSTKDFGNRFSLGLNVSRKVNQQQDGPDTDWFGTAVYAQFRVKDFLALGIRGEYMNDPDGVIMEENSGSIFSFTFSTNFKHHGFTFIPEFRIDRANDPIFETTDNGLTEVSPAILTALIYSF
ncbi:MAG: porin [Bacteroidota bacterium]